MGPKSVPEESKSLCVGANMEWDGMKSITQNLCQILQRRSPGVFKTSPGGSQNRDPGRPRKPRCTQKSPKTSSEGPTSVQEAPKKRSRAPKRCPRDAQEGPGDPKHFLKSSPARSERVLDAFGCVQGARGGHILEKNVLRSLCERVSFCFFDDREKRGP